VGVRFPSSALNKLQYVNGTCFYDHQRFAGCFPLHDAQSHENLDRQTGGPNQIPRRQTEVNSETKKAGDEPAFLF